MAKITANGHKEIARFVKSGGETVVLTQNEKGKTRCLRKWTGGASYTVASIPVGRRGNGAPIYSDRPTREQFVAWAESQSFERTAVRS